MMGRLNHDQEQLLYSFHLDEAAPHDHPVRKIAAVLDLSWVHCDLAPFYPKMGRPSIDPELMIRMLIIGYVLAVRSERAICRDVQVNLAYRWFCGLSIEDKIPDHSAFSRARHERFRDSNMFRRGFERVVEACITAGLVGGEGSRSMRAGLRRTPISSDRSPPRSGARPFEPRRLTPSLSRPTVNNELSSAFSLTRRIPVAFAGRNDRALHQHMPCLCKFFGLAQLRIVGQRTDNRPNLG